MKSNNRWRSIGTAFGVALVAGLLAGNTPRVTLAQPPEFDFTLIVTLGDPAPGGGNFTFDFEPWSINNRSEVAFAADLTTGGEGVFLARKGQISEIMRSGQPAPGGGTFGALVWGHTDLNGKGDVAFAFALDPFTFPLGMNSGIYRFTHATGTLSAVMVPGVTPAPGGGTFQGAFLHASINNRGDIAFAGIVPTTAGISGDLGIGVFLADKKGQISSVLSPGDPAPGGGTFDFAENPWINDKGDIAFGAHVAGEECIDLGVPQSVRIFCAESVYVKKAASGEIQSIAHQGDPAPGGGTYRLAFGPVLNNRGDIAFIGDLTPAPAVGEDLAVFLHSKGETVPVARPGDPMPGGGNLARASFVILDAGLNNRSNVAFSAILDTDENDDGVDDTGLYVSSRAVLHLVARTGTMIPGVGTIAHLGFPDAPNVSTSPLSGAAINNRGQVFFHATLTDGTGVLLIATPSDGQ
jgi:hypothetical protein